MTAIQTATGPIDSAELGFTLMHEHVYSGWSPMMLAYPETFDRAAVLDDAVTKLKQAHAAGVRTIVDLTPIDLGRDPLLIRDAAEQSGVQIIVATGFYHQVPFYFNYRPSEEMTALFVRDITEGIASSGVRAGVIKCATEEQVHRMNDRVLRASAAAHRQTGVPICTHTSPQHRTGLDQQRIFGEEGVDLGRVVIGHSDDTDDLAYLEQIIDAGSYCGMDRIGLQAPFTTEQRVDTVAALVEKGYADRITLSHDCCCTIDWMRPDVPATRMPEWRLTHIPQDVIPMLRERGVSDADIEQMTIVNPRRIFEANEPY